MFIYAWTSFEHVSWVGMAVGITVGNHSTTDSSLLTQKKLIAVYLGGVYHVPSGVHLPSRLVSLLIPSSPNINEICIQLRDVRFVRLSGSESMS